MTWPSEAACRVSAPGKLLLFGEYAVLEGGVATVAAIDRHVRIAVCPGHHDDDAMHYALAHPAGEALVAVTGESLADPGATAAFLQACVRALPPDFPRGALAGLDLRVDCGALVADESGAKLGLGSSAASCVALVSALTWAAGRPIDRAAVLRAALAAHRAIQGGGSGVDVAAATFGGVLRFQWTGGELPEVARQPADGMPPWAAIWLGESASTPSFLAHVDALRLRAPRRHRRCLDALARVGAEAAAAFARRDAAAILAAVSDAEAALDALGAAAGAPIVCEAHRRLSTAARAAGLVCKPSGAGGGDLSLVFAPEPPMLTAFLARLPEGLRAMALQLDAHGVRCEPADAVSSQAGLEESLRSEPRDRPDRSRAR